MVVVKKISRRTVKLTGGTDSDVAKAETPSPLPKNSLDDDDRKEDEKSDERKNQTPNLSEVNTSTPLNSNWDGLVQTIHTIGTFNLIKGNAIANRASLTIDQIYELASSTPNVELPAVPASAASRHTSPNERKECLEDLNSLKVANTLFIILGTTQNLKRIPNFFGGKGRRDNNTCRSRKTQCEKNYQRKTSNN
jgi:hypothetical protein